MKILHSLSELSEVDGPVAVAVGVFDGVHLGHQAVIGRALADAEKFSGTAVVLTFHPHPMRVLRPERVPHLLTSTAHKIRLIERMGVRYLLTAQFDAAFAAQTPEGFIKQLAEACKLREICVGEQWAFGRGRSGNVDLLRRLGRTLGFGVAEASAVTVDGKVVSSTRIRSAVETGDFETARRCLGREFTILGTVEAGRQIGREMGFPAANLRAHNEQFPPDGVYAIWAQLGERLWEGVANIGYRPTLVEEAPQRTLEVHLFDFSENIYGADVEVTFVHYLRGEKRFANREALRAQMAADAKAAQKILMTS